MYIIRYEKEPIIYEVPDEHIIPIVSANNNFELCYFNNDLCNIRLYFKLIVHNKNIQYFIDTVFIYINSIFNTVNDDWTITLNEYMFNNNHIINLYFYSNKYHINIKYLKTLIDSLYHRDITFDTSIYYKNNSKYENLITSNLPNQVPFKKYKKYKILCGNTYSLLLTNLNNLIEYKIGCLET